MSTGNFRKSLFGGFNRIDVSDYIIRLAKERNEYKERAEAAEEKLAAAECEPAEFDAPETEYEAFDEDDAPDVERMLTEIQESVAAVNAGIQQSVASIKGEPEHEEEKKPASADDISRVLGMLECTEAQFAVLEKTLKEMREQL